MKAKAALATLLIACLALASLTQAEVSQQGNLRVTYNGAISPTKLPREGSAPVRVKVSAAVSSTKAGRNPPQLQTIAIAINRHGILDSTGLPVCELREIQPSTTAKALEECRASLVGAGSFEAKVLLPQQSPFPSAGKLHAYNGTYKGKPAILAHVYGTDPAPTSFTLPFVIKRSQGAFATTLTTNLPQVTSEWGYVTGLSLDLHRTYRYRGKARSYLSASCPAPKGFPGASFSFAKVSFGFKGRSLAPPPLQRACKARG